MTDAKQAAFEQTYLAYRELLYRAAYQILRNEAQAEDAAAEAFCRIWENYAFLREPVGDDARRFSVTVVRHIALNQLRRRRRFPEVEFDEQLPAAQRDAEAALDVRAALSRLKPDTRSALLLCYASGLTAAQTAQVLHFSVSKTEKLISRGRIKLKKLLGGDGYEIRD